MSGQYDIAMVEWAPNGRWGEADSVKAGEYSKFQNRVFYNRPSPPPSPSATNLAISDPTEQLASSDRTGLLGVPLPESARLIERTAGDVGAGRDPMERYEISASAAEIMAFYSKAMSKAGWAKDGVWTPTAAFFVKGAYMIGVLTNKDGRTFTLMGS